MLLICSHPVFEKTRVIKNNQQLYLEHEVSLKLYDDEVMAPNERFKMVEVHDVSYKGFSDNYGFLYLHTIKGVRAYMVKEHPAYWMDALKEQLAQR